MDKDKKVQNPKILIGAQFRMQFRGMEISRQVALACVKDFEYQFYDKSLEVPMYMVVYIPKVENIHVFTSTSFLVDVSFTLIPNGVPINIEKYVNHVDKILNEVNAQSECIALAPVHYAKFMAALRQLEYQDAVNYVQFHL